MCHLRLDLAAPRSRSPDKQLNSSLALRIQLRRVYIYILCVTLCASGASFAHAADEYVFLLRARGNPYWSLVAAGVKDAAAKLGVKAIAYQMDSESGSEEQLNNCAVAIERAPKLIAIAAVNTAVGIQCLRRARDRGIKVAEIDSTMPAADAERAGVSLSFSVGSDNFLIGARAAEYAAKLQSGLDPKVFILEGAPGNDAGLKRKNGFVKRLGELLPKAKIVASLPADWDRLKALSATSDILQREPNLSLIYAANDMMALGASEALRIAGKSGAIPVIGVDGVADARKAVLEGRITATIAQLPYFMGWRAVELAVRKDDGFVREDTPTPVLSREVLKSNTDPLLQYVR